MKRYILSLAICAAGVASYSPVCAGQAFDPRRAKEHLIAPATQVMVLGVSHLDNAPEAFDPAWLEPVMCRLRAYAPDVILTEAMSGEQLAAIDAYKAVRGDAGKWAGPTLAIARDAQATLKISAADALAQANILIAGTRPTASERRRLAALFLAAGEPFSAATQWLQLDPAERLARDGVSETMKPRLSALAWVAARSSRWPLLWRYGSAVRAFTGLATTSAMWRCPTMKPLAKL